MQHGWEGQAEKHGPAHRRPPSTRGARAAGWPCCSNLDRQRKIAKGWTRSDKREAARFLSGAAVHKPPLRAAILKQICSAAKSCKADIRVKGYMTSELGTRFKHKNVLATLRLNGLWCKCMCLQSRRRNRKFRTTVRSKPATDGGLRGQGAPSKQKICHWKKHKAKTVMIHDGDSGRDRCSRGHRHRTRAELCHREQTQFWSPAFALDGLMRQHFSLGVSPWASGMMTEGRVRVMHARRLRLQRWRKWCSSPRLRRYHRDGAVPARSVRGKFWRAEVLDRRSEDGIQRHLTGGTQYLH